MQHKLLQSSPIIADQTALWDKRATAKYLNISISTVDQWVSKGRGPRHIKLGALVRFRPEDIQDFIDQRTRETAA